MAAPTTPKQAIADICGISERQVDKLASLGVLPKPDKPGLYDVQACIKAYIQHRERDRRLYSTKEMATLLGCTEPMIYRHREAGMPMVDKATWDIQACVRWLIQRERDKAHKAGAFTDASGEELAQERLLAAREERLLKQMTREAKDRSLIRRSECEAGWAALAGIVVAALEALPGRLAQPMAEAEDVLTARRGLFEEVRRMRAELARTLQEHADAAREPDLPAGDKPASVTARRRAAGRRHSRAAARPDRGSVG